MADKEYQTIVSLVQEVVRLGQQFGIAIPENPYTTLHAQVRFHNCLVSSEFANLYLHFSDNCKPFSLAYNLLLS